MTLCDRSGVALPPEGVILTRFSSDCGGGCCCCCCDDGVLDSDRDSAAAEVDCGDEGDDGLDADSPAPCDWDGGGLPSFANRLLRIYNMSWNQHVRSEGMPLPVPLTFSASDKLSAIFESDDKTTQEN